MTMETKHWAVIGALLVTIGTQIATLQHGWHDAASPAFVGALLLQIGTTIAALFVGSPTEKK